MSLPIFTVLRAWDEAVFVVVDVLNAEDGSGGFQGLATNMQAVLRNQDRSACTAVERSMTNR
jgi:hypothetical protein